MFSKTGLLSSVFYHFTGNSPRIGFFSNFCFAQKFTQFTKYANSYLNSFISVIFFVVGNLGWDLFRSVQHRLHYILFVRLCPCSNWQFSDFNFGFGNLTKKLESSKISIINWQNLIGCSRVFKVNFLGVYTAYFFI
jgi:hypothetical protein